MTNYGLSQALSGNIDGAETALREAAAKPDADSRVRQNLALVLGLQGKFQEMKAVDSAAPVDIMKQNAEVLQRMIERETPLTTRSEEVNLSKLQPPALVPATKEATASHSEPVQRIEKAPTEPVASAGLPDLTIPTPASKLAGPPKPAMPAPKPVAPVQTAKLASKAATEAKQPETRPEVPAAANPELLEPKPANVVKTAKTEPKVPAAKKTVAETTKIPVQPKPKKLVKAETAVPSQEKPRQVAAGKPQITSKTASKPAAQPAPEEASEKIPFLRGSLD